MCEFDVPVPLSTGAVRKFVFLARSLFLYSGVPADLPRAPDGCALPHLTCFLGRSGEVSNGQRLLSSRTLGDMLHGV